MKTNSDTISGWRKGPMNVVYLSGSRTIWTRFLICSGPYFDWALNEQCFEYNECETLTPFINAGKPVFNTEYELETQEFCARAMALEFRSIKKNWDLDAWREPCD